MNKPRREALQKIATEIHAIMDELEPLRDEEEEYRDSIPENMQGSERYEKAEEYAQLLGDAYDSLENAVSSIESTAE